MRDVLTVLTSEDEEEIRVAIKDIIVQQVKNDFENYDSYLFNPSQIEGMIEEVVEDVKEEYL